MTQQRTVRKRERKSERESGREAHTGSTLTQDATDVSDFMPKQHSSHSALSRCRRVDLHQLLFRVGSPRLHK